jgi:transcriptional regulator with XRE-family HTH domain
MIKKRKQLAAEEVPEFQASIDALPEDSRIFVDKSLEIAHFIHFLMEQKGMKQKDLAGQLNKSEAEMSKILGGMQNLTLRTIAKLEAALGTDIIRTAKVWYTFKQSAPSVANAEVVDETEEQAATYVNYSLCPVVSIRQPKKKLSNIESIAS